MKRIVAVLVVLCLSASFAVADYYDPPGWEDNPYFTHQSWDFLDNCNPAPPDGEIPVVSPGNPCVSFQGGVWTNDPIFGPTDGGLLFSGPMAADPMNPQMAIYVPNIENPDLVKEIWLQIAINTNYWGLTETLQFFAVANGDIVYPPNPEDVNVEVVNEATGRVRLTALITIDPQPADEWIYITAGLPSAGDILFVDEVDVDTRCIPEPSTLAMLLAAGSLCFVAYRRLK